MRAGCRRPESKFEVHRFDRVEIGLREVSHALALGQVLADQSVRVLVQSAV